MTVTTRSAGGESPQPAAPLEDAPPVSLLGNVSGDHCAVCAAELTLDQRYCVECGTRRGVARFKLASSGSARADSSTNATAAPAARIFSVATLLLATAVVLLALGVGVLIGHAGHTTTLKPVVTVIQSGGATSSSGGSTSGTGGSKTSSTSGKQSSGTSSSCSSTTAGCKNGKQTGNFFGG